MIKSQCAKDFNVTAATNTRQQIPAPAMFSPPARLGNWTGMVQRMIRTQQQSNSLLQGNQCSPPESAKISVSPSQTDRQVVASGRKLNLPRDALGGQTD